MHMSERYVPLRKETFMLCFHYNMYPSVCKLYGFPLSGPKYVRAHCRFPWLKLCPQDSVIRVVLFHGLVCFFLFFFYEGETQSWRLSQIFILEEVVKLYMKKKRQKRKAAVSLHGHVLLTKWKYHREDGLNLGELRPREKWNHEWTHMHKKKKKTYMDNLALLWEQKTCHLKVPGIAAKEKI